jgi:predicted nucleic acid-binding protein
VRFVLDCSIALKWFVPEPLSDEAVVVLGRHHSGALDLVAPEVVLAEFGHGLRRDVVSGDLSREKATEALEDFLAIGVPTVPTRELAPRAFALALEHMATFYDALYVALAELEDVKVLTADERMVNAFAKLDRTVALASYK